MRILVIYAHPAKAKNHNALVLKEVLSFLDGKAAEYRLIDLYRDGFDPVMPPEEWGDAKYNDERVVEYQRAVRGADRLVFIYPVWWYAYPAILKGFFDRVFTAGFAYKFRKESGIAGFVKSMLRWLISVRTLYPLFLPFHPVEPRLTGKKALVINTFGGDESGFRLFGHTPQYVTDRAVLEFCGIRPVYRVDWFNARKDSAMPPYVRRDVLSRLAKLLE